VSNLTLEWRAELVIWEISNSKLGLGIGCNLYICRDLVLLRKWQRIISVWAKTPSFSFLFQLVCY